MEADGSVVLLERVDVSNNNMPGRSSKRILFKALLGLCLHLKIFDYDDTLSSSSNRSTTILSIQCNNTNELPQGWCLDNNAVPRYIDIVNDVHNTSSREEETQSTIELSRYSVEGFEQCLANKTVVFIGESRVRFQYMHLGLMLKTGKFMNCQDRDSYDMECLGIALKQSVWKSWVGDGNVASYNNASDWNDMFKYSTIMLNSYEQEHYNQSQSTMHHGGDNNNRQVSLCDCFRVPNEYAYDHHFENRYTRRNTVFGEINLIYLQNQRDRISMNKDFPPYVPFYNPNNKRCKPGECGRWSTGDSTNAYVGNLKSSLYDIIPLLNTTHLFVNSGWDFERDISCELKEFSKSHPDIKVTYLSQPLDISGKVQMLDPRKMKCKIDTIDRTSMTEGVPQSWYVDSVHVWSILNEEFNHQLIKMIC